MKDLIFENGIPIEIPYDVYLVLRKEFPEFVRAAVSKDQSQYRLNIFGMLTLLKLLSVPGVELGVNLSLSLVESDQENLLPVTDALTLLRLLTAQGGE